MRLGCCLLCISLLLGLACPLQAHALAAEAVIALCAAYLACVGYNLAAHDMNASGTSNAIAKMLTDFLNEVFAGDSILSWAGAHGLTDVSVTSGSVNLPASAANALAQFAGWAKDKYGDTPGTEAVVSSDQGFIAADGKFYAFTVLNDDVHGGNSTVCYDFNVGTTIFNPVPESDFSDFSIPITSDISLYIYLQTFSSGSQLVVFEFSPYSGSSFRSIYTYYPTGIGEGAYYLNVSNISFVVDHYGKLTVGAVCHPVNGSSSYFSYSVGLNAPELSDLNLTGGSLTIGVIKGLTIPVLADGEALKLNTGNPAITTLEGFGVGVIQGVQAGTLTVEAEVVDTVDVPIDPPVEPTAPDIDGLGLPALGAALTSRFPFSIPWDVAKGVQLLAAPAKAPYWEVDFLAPISYRVGGWQGDTTWVIDMSEYEIIGQLSRWASTIGFCLLLASGTKRLIWTA